MGKERIAFIAHNAMKAQMVSFVMQNKELIQSLNYNLVTTGSTGNRLEESGFEIYKKYRSGHDGGDIDIASRVLDNKIIAVFFFIDTKSAHPHDADIMALIRACVLRGVPLSLTPEHAQITLKGLSKFKK